MRIFAIVTGTLFLIWIDILSKVQSVKLLGPHGEYVSVISDWIGWKLAYNYGVAFSMPIQGLFLQVLTVTLICALLFYYIRYEYPRKNRWIDLSFVLIFSGAVSHAYERIAHGYVVDFIFVKYFAILNFADIFISIGACILIFFTYVNSRKSR